MLVSILNIVGICLLIILLAYLLDEKCVSVIPISTGLVMFLLYLLAFLRAMIIIDYIWIAEIAVFLILIIRKKIKVESLKSKITDIEATAVIIYVIVYFLSRNLIAMDWDEMGIWSLEVKSMYYLNGFAEKYKHSSLLYGTYHPGQMLFEWWICRSGSPYEYKEGLMYVGYYWLYISFLIPALKNLKIKKLRRIPVVAVISSALFLLIPSTIEIFSYQFLSAELLLSAGFAYLLYSYFDKDNHNQIFNLLNYSTSFFQLFMIKETGIEYVIIAIVVGNILNWGTQQKENKKLDWKVQIFSIIIPCISIIVWKRFCILQERTTYFSGHFFNRFEQILSNITENGDFAINIIYSMAKAIFDMPLHGKATKSWDLTLAMCVIVTEMLIWFVFYDKKNLHHLSAKILSISYLSVIFISIIALLYMHIFVFRESQYLEEEIMVKSISRYLEPVLLGFILYCVFYAAIYLKNKYKLLCIVTGILLCANYRAPYVRFFSNKDKIIAEEDRRQEIFQRNSMLLKSINQELGGVPSRILYVVVQDDSITDIDKRWLPFLICPHSIDIIQTDAINTHIMDQIYLEIEKWHCEYIFFLDNSDDGEAAEQLEKNVLCKVVYNNGYQFNIIE